MSNPISGVFNIMATPFDAEGHLDVASLRRLVDFQIERGAYGLTILGVLGEAAKLSVDERKLVVETVLGQNAGRVPVVVGTSHAEVQTCIALSQAAVAAGAVGVMISPPRFEEPSDDKVLNFYETVAAAYPGAIVVQDFPPVNDIIMSPDLLFLRHELCAGQGEGHADQRFVLGREHHRRVGLRRRQVPTRSACLAPIPGADRLGDKHMRDIEILLCLWLRCRGGPIDFQRHYFPGVAVIDEHHIPRTGQPHVFQASDIWYPINHPKQSDRPGLLACPNVIYLQAVRAIENQLIIHQCRVIQEWLVNGPKRFPRVETIGFNPRGPLIDAVVNEQDRLVARSEGSEVLQRQLHRQGVK